MSNWNKVFKPIVVLCVICIIITGALAATNSVPAPIIEAATIAAQHAARTELLPAADSMLDPIGRREVLGTIKQLKVTEAAETKGIGSNVSEGVSYWENYTGKSADKALVLGTDVDAYTGATISSKALNAAVNSAIEAYNMIP